jgi:ribosome-associated translation inhibitor RaiA
MKLNYTNNGNKAKISLLYRGLRPGTLWDTLVTTQIARLQHLASILSARITLERRRHSHPAFRVLAFLEVPGPDYHAEATDYTLRAALLKVIENLRRQMQSRKNRQINRRKNKARLAFMGRPAFSMP